MGHRKFSANPHFLYQKEKNSVRALDRPRPLLTKNTGTEWKNPPDLKVIKKVENESHIANFISSDQCHKGAITTIRYTNRIAPRFGSLTRQGGIDPSPGRWIPTLRGPSAGRRWRIGGSQPPLQGRRLGAVEEAWLAVARRRRRG